MPSVTVRGLAADPSSPGTVYAGGMDGRVYVTDDAGRDLAAARAPACPTTASSIGSSSAEPTTGKLYAAAASGV